ncbi:hypothetical protein A6R68_19666, partial [Neotoma lepida]
FLLFFTLLLKKEHVKSKVKNRRNLLSSSLEVAAALVRMALSLNEKMKKQTWKMMANNIEKIAETK